MPHKSPSIRTLPGSRVTKTSRPNNTDLTGGAGKTTTGTMTFGEQQLHLSISIKNIYQYPSTISIDLNIHDVIGIGRKPLTLLITNREYE
jgi:hypothetical protein